MLQDLMFMGEKTAANGFSKCVTKFKKLPFVSARTSSFANITLWMWIQVMTVL